MKRKLLFPLVALCIAGCSNHTETATESTTAVIQPQKDSLSEWLAKIQNDPQFKQKLSEVLPPPDYRVSFEGICDDPVVSQTLKKRHYQPVVLQSGRNGLKDALDVFDEIPSHGTKFVSAHIEQIKTLANDYSGPADQPEFTLTSEDLTFLESTLKKRSFDPDDPNADSNLIQLLQGQECYAFLPRYCEYTRDVQKIQTETLDRTAKLDALITCDLTAWAAELRLNYPQNDYKFDRFRKFISDESIIATRKEVFIEDMARRGIKPAFDQIQPPDPQYALLRKAREIYTTAIENGGWPAVAAPSKIVQPTIGKSYDYVPSMKKRLAAEGYNITDVESDVFDQALSDAIYLYRDVHQLNDKKVLDNVLFKNFTVSPELRLETIDLSLQRYREAAVGSLRYFVRVNIPDFHVEVWKDGQRLLRHRIVVGNDKLEKDPETGKLVPDPETLYPLHPNRTPIQTSKINEIILNPYWNVPPRIRIQELEPKLAENPNYYEENNYEEVNVDNPKLYYVREKPNPKNSLGKVKFMFPNPHNTYLHDTPAKAVFKNPTRAMSHGCMRVQNPLDLARILLTNDGQYNEREFNSIINADPPEQVTLTLKNPVDVDVIYINARVDDSGVAAFLSDVYQYDAVRLGKVKLQKLPRPKDWKNPAKGR